VTTVTRLDVLKKYTNSQTNYNLTVYFRVVGPFLARATLGIVCWFAG